MKRKKRLWKTPLGIPIWMVIGFSVFLICSAGYELLQDYSPLDGITTNWIVVILATLILIIAIVFNFTKTRTIIKIFNGQMGK